MTRKTPHLLFTAFRCFSHCFSRCFSLFGLKDPKSTKSKKQRRKEGPALCTTSAFGAQPEWAMKGAQL
jgi:hypothetical protein